MKNLFAILGMFVLVGLAIAEDHTLVEQPLDKDTSLQGKLETTGEKNMADQLSNHTTSISNSESPLKSNPSETSHNPTLNDIISNGKKSPEDHNASISDPRDSKFAGDSQNHNSSPNDEPRKSEVENSSPLKKTTSTSLQNDSTIESDSNKSKESSKISTGNSGDSSINKSSKSSNPKVQSQKNNDTPPKELQPQDKKSKKNLTEKQEKNFLNQMMNPLENFLLKIFGKDGSVFSPFSAGFGKPKQEAKENETIIKLDTHYRIGNHPMTYTLQSDLPTNSTQADSLNASQYIFNLYGVGVIKVEIFENSTSKVPLKSEKITLDVFLKPSYLPIDHSRYFNKKGNVMAISNEMNDMISPSSFELTYRKPLEVPFDSNIKIFTVLSNITNFIVVHNNKNSTKENKPEEKDLEKRLQFILDSSIERQKVTGSESLDMFINKKPEFPTNKNYDIKASGSLGNGLIKTLSSTNPLYCTSDECKYYVSVYSENVNFVTFMPSVFANGATLKFDHFMFLIEELEVGEHISYILEVPKNDDDWLFSVFPMEGSAELFVNPDERPQDLNQFKYTIGSQRNEEILITAFEAKKFGFTNQKFYVSYRSLNPDRPVTFRFETRRLTQGRRNYIKEDVAESGVAAMTETIQYYMTFQNFEDDFVEALDVGLRLDTYFGNADIFVKECLMNEADCRITEADIKNSFDKDYKQKYNDRIFMFSHFDNSEVNEITSTTHHTNFDRQRIRLRVNCMPFIQEFANKLFNLPTNDSKMKSQIRNGFPISDTCNFVIGVNCRKSDNKYGAYYRLIVAGENTHSDLYLQHSRTLKIPEKGHDYLKLWVKKNELLNATNLNLKVIAISGKFKVYVSTKTEFPNEHNHEIKIDMNDDNLSSLHTMIKEVKIPIPRKSDNDSEVNPEIMANSQPHKYQLNKYGGIEEVKNILLDPSHSLQDIRESSTAFRYDPLHQSFFISVEADTFTIVDIYAEKIENSNIIITPAERLLPSKLVHRSITNEKASKFVNLDKVIYFKNFYYKYHPWHNKDEKESTWLDIKLNSNIFGLKLCVQVDTDVFDMKRNCDFSSDNQSLSISEDKYQFIDGKNIVISVQKHVSNKEDFNKFPIDFSIFVNPGENDTVMELMSANKVFGTSLDPFQTITFKIDLNTVKQSFLLLFESEDLNMQAELSLLSKKEYTYMETLTKFNFGIYIPSVYNFKKKKCKDDCKLQLLVYSSASEKSKFSVAYSADQKPLLLKEGDEISIPNNIDQYFVYEADNNEPINFSVTSNHVSHVLYSKIINEPSRIGHELSDIDFSLKTDIDSFTQIVYPKFLLKSHSPQTIGFFYQPKYTFEKMAYKPEEGFIRLKETNKARLSIRSKISKLSAFYDTTEQCNKDDFNYYYLSPDNSSKFTIMLSKLSGITQLYINKGLDDFPTLRRYWKKSTGLQGEEIFVNEEESNSSSPNTNGYVVGVYCKEMAQYSLLYLPDFTNLIKLQFQKLVDFNLQKGKEYYFDYYNKHQMFHTILYTDDSDLEVAALDFKVTNNQNFAQMVSDPTNYKQSFIFKKGSIPRKHVTMDEFLVNKHIVVKMKALDNDTKLTFAIFDPLLPIIAFNEKRFHYVLNTSEGIEFVVKLGEDFEDIDIDIKLDIGDIEFSISDKVSSLPNSLPKNVLSDHMPSPSQKSYTYNVAKKPKVNDIVVFNEIYIKVKANVLSKFSIFTKPKNKFKELKSFESEIVYTDPERDQYLYYFVSSKEISKIKSFQIQISSASFYGEKPELLFIPDVEVLIDESTPFLPMPLLDIQEHHTDEFVLLTVTPDLRVGHFVIRVMPHPSKLPIKISVSINDNVRVSPNGVHHALVPANEIKNHNYNLMLPEKGEFRIIVETCYNIDLKSAEFYSINGDTASKVYHFDQNYVQAYNYMQFNDFGDLKQRELKEVTYSVKRGFVEEPGMLTFKLEIPPVSTDGTSPITSNYYSLLTEFKASNKDLILKDYITVFDESKDSDKYLFNYEFKNNGKLKVFSRMPTFKPQLFVEYPGLKHIRVKLMFYIVADEQIESKVRKCGFNIVETLNHVKHNITKTLTREELLSNPKSAQIEIDFAQEDLDLFSNSPFVNIVSYASIKFFENENDEYGVTLDQKFTTVPYFLMTIPNKQMGFDNNLIVIVACVFIFAIVVIILLNKLCKKKPEEIQRFGYEKGESGSFGSSTRLEMTSIDTSRSSD